MGPAGNVSSPEPAMWACYDEQPRAQDERAHLLRPGSGSPSLYVLFQQLQALAGHATMRNMVLCGFRYSMSCCNRRLRVLKCLRESA